MATGGWSGRRGWALLIGVIVACATALTVIAVLPPPSGGSCTTCQGRDLSTIMALGPGTNVGSSSERNYCFPVEWVHGSLSIQNLDVAIQYANGVVLPPDRNYTVAAVAGNGTTVATYYFSDFNGVEGPLWVGAVDASVVGGFSFCLATGADNLAGLYFVLAGVGFDPTGEITQPIPSS